MTLDPTLTQARLIIAGFLRARRNELGISQVELARRTGLGVNTIIRAENAQLWLGMKQYLILCRELQLDGIGCKPIRKIGAE